MAIAPSSSYLAKRASFKTQLIRQGPAPEEWEDFPLPERTKEIRYDSDGLALKAYVQFPDDDMQRKKPVIVFFHGGCALKECYFLTARPFVEAGFLVMFPTFRGENGNPGNYELFFGEVDDARAAIHWLVQQPYADRELIYTFGTSMGGEISALLSLYADLPVRFGGSCGPFFPRKDRFGPESMYHAPVPFDIHDEEECSMRTLAGNISDMQRKHYAFIGTEDEKFESKAYKHIETENTLLEIIEVPGTHGTSGEFAVQEFLQRITLSC
jgi:dienelactone hydrolase